MKRKELMRRVRNCRGITLIEVILSIAILGVLATFIIGVLANAIGVINRAGDLDRTGYTAAQVAENAISRLSITPTPDGDGIVITGQSGKTVTVPNSSVVDSIVTVTFPSGSIDIPGKKIEITTTGNEKVVGEKNEVTIEVFIPDEKE
ncbi:MAG TPA: type II secretion system protein [Desulfitobacteriaceae bacterium]|nr:type II secretion system protein [Desulfitobacteriaceae bacterium]